MLVIGLTGNIASGKTEVARIFAELGATVIDADDLARKAVEVGTPALAAIVERWGDRVLNPDGTLDRAALRSIVFSSDAAREHLNSIVHPEVKRLRDIAISQARARGDAVVIAVIPLLYEVGLEKDFDRVIVVDAPAALRLNRLIERRAMDASEARRIMEAQIPAASKRRRADLVIENDGDLVALRRAVEQAWRTLIQRGVD